MKSSSLLFLHVILNSWTDRIHVCSGPRLCSCSCAQLTSWAWWAGSRSGGSSGHLTSAFSNTSASPPRFAAWWSWPRENWRPERSAQLSLHHFQSRVVSIIPPVSINNPWKSCIQEPSAQKSRALFWRTVCFLVKQIYPAARFHSSGISLQEVFVLWKDLLRFFWPLMPLVRETRLQSKPVNVMNVFSVHHSASLSGCSPPESPAPERSSTRMTGIWTDLSLLQSEYKALFFLSSSYLCAMQGFPSCCLPRRSQSPPPDFLIILILCLV